MSRPSSCVPDVYRRFRGLTKSLETLGAVVSRPVRRILSRVVIHLGRRLPDDSCGLPGSWADRPLPV
jgi:hypothetical protein